LALKEYSYQPTAKAKLINWGQILIISTLPAALIYPVYTVIRGIQSLKQMLAHPESQTAKMNLWLKTSPN